MNRFSSYIIYFLSFALYMSCMSSCALNRKKEDTDTKIEFQSKELELDTGSGTLFGTLLSPIEKTKTPIVILISGSGPTDRNGNNPMMENNALKMLAEALADNNISSFRYDKRGIGKSINAGKEESLLRFDMYVNDASAWVNKIKASNKYSSTIVAGHSEGALIGILLSKKTKIQKLISLAGAGRSADALISEQVTKQFPLLGTQTDSCLAILRDGKTIDSVPPMLLSLFRPSVQEYMISWMKYNPSAEIATLDIPTLIVQGKNDLQVGIKDAQNLRKANKNSKMIQLDSMNHILKNSPADIFDNFQTYADPDLPLNQKMVDAVIKFIKE